MLHLQCISFLVSAINIYSTVVTICAMRYNTHKFYVMSTHCLYMFCMGLKTKIISLDQMSPCLSLSTVAVIRSWPTTVKPA